jgi:hypothetical protein
MYWSLNEASWRDVSRDFSAAECATQKNINPTGILPSQRQTAPSMWPFQCVQWRDGTSGSSPFPRGCEGHRATGTGDDRTIMWNKTMTRPWQDHDKTMKVDEGRWRLGVLEGKDFGFDRRNVETIEDNECMHRIASEWQRWKIFASIMIHEVVNCARIVHVGASKWIWRPSVFGCFWFLDGLGRCKRVQRGGGLCESLRLEATYWHFDAGLGNVRVQHRQACFAWILCRLRHCASDWLTLIIMQYHMQFLEMLRCFYFHFVTLCIPKSSGCCRAIW